MSQPLRSQVVDALESWMVGLKAYHQVYRYLWSCQNDKGVGQTVLKEAADLPKVSKPYENGRVADSVLQISVKQPAPHFEEAFFTSPCQAWLSAPACDLSAPSQDRNGG